MSGDRDLRFTFDTVAAAYQDARPDYPEQLYTDLLAMTGLDTSADMLEIGCGPGKATLPLARLGFSVTGLELGPALANEARRRLAPFTHVTVINTAFEQWRPEPDVRFDLAYAATAWKWIDPAIRYPHAAALLKPGGYLAVWAADAAYPPGFDPIFAEIQDDYEHIGEARIPWPPPEPTPETATAAEMESSGYFDSIQTGLYVWPVRYDADRFIALLNTFSGHIAMDPPKRDYLYRAVRARLANRPDGNLIRHYSATLTIGRRRAATERGNSIAGAISDT